MGNKVEHPAITRPGLGPVHARVIALIAKGEKHHKSIARRMNDYGGAEAILVVLGGLVRRGYLTQGRGHLYSLTSKAIDTLPRAVPAWWATTTYTPPIAPPRRPGSDHSHLPSMAAGLEREYVRHV